MPCHHSESAFSTVEVLVALVLLISVWMPLVHFGVGFLGKPHNARTMTALVLARNVMERTLHDQDFTPAVYISADGKWHTRRAVAQTGRRVVLRIAVYRISEPNPRVHLMTVRFTTDP